MRHPRCGQVCRQHYVGADIHLDARRPDCRRHKRSGPLAIVPLEGVPVRPMTCASGCAAAASVPHRTYCGGICRHPDEDALVRRFRVEIRRQHDPVAALFLSPRIFCVRRLPFCRWLSLGYPADPPAQGEADECIGLFRTRVQIREHGVNLSLRGPVLLEDRSLDRPPGIGPARKPRPADSQHRLNRSSRRQGTNRLLTGAFTRATVFTGTVTSRTSTISSDLISPCSGGGAWESNPPTNRKLPYDRFEDGSMPAAACSSDRQLAGFEFKTGSRLRPA